MKFFIEQGSPVKIEHLSSQFSSQSCRNWKLQHSAYRVLNYCKFFSRNSEFYLYCLRILTLAIFIYRYHPVKIVSGQGCEIIKIIVTHTITETNGPRYSYAVECVGWRGTFYNKVIAFKFAGCSPPDYNWFGLRYSSKPINFTGSAMPPAVYWNDSLLMPLWTVPPKSQNVPMLLEG